MKKSPKEKIQSKVNIRPIEKGFVIQVSDQFTVNFLAITEEELKKIVLYGQIILKSLTK